MALYLLPLGVVVPHQDVTGTEDTYNPDYGKALPAMTGALIRLGRSAAGRF